MRKKGYTLLELIIVLVLLAILSVAATVKMVNFDSIRLSSAASKLAADIAYAQQLAVTTQMPHGVSFVTGTNSYYSVIDHNSNAVEDPANRGSDLIVNYSSIPDLKDVDITGASTTPVWFDWQGTPSSNVTVTLGCGTETPKTITITADTGKVIW